MSSLRRSAAPRPVQESSFLVVTDVVDSTALGERWQREGHGAERELWAAHDRAARDLIRRHGGREIGRADGVLALFGDAAAALAFAGDYHDALAVLEPPMRARAGVHAGPASLRTNSEADVAQGATPFELDGPMLPVAVRAMSLAQGGQTLLTDAAATAAAGADNHAPARLAALGHWSLKGVEQPVALFEWLRRGELPAPPADGDKGHRVVRVEGDWRPAHQAAARWPTERTPLLGRAALLDQAAQALAEGTRLLTLLGPGGIGKTRIAVRLLRALGGTLPGGGWFCDLSAAQSGEQMVQALALALDVPLRPQDPQQQLSLALAARGRCLVVLDNLEQLDAAALPLLAGWLAVAPEARFIATSRLRLGLPEELALPVPALPAPDAVALFQARARAAGVVLAARESACLPELVALLDGLPLALELAAARAAVLPPSTMLVRVHERLRFLARTRPQPQDRHASLRAVLEGSWELLEPTQQALLAQISVFEDGFRLVAAEAVFAPNGADGSAPWIGDGLQALADHSLLIAADESGRLRLLQTVRDFAAEQLDASGDAAGAMQRHWRHFAALAEIEVDHPGFADLANLAVACEHATEAGDGTAAATLLVLQAEVLMRRGPVQRLNTLAARVLAMTSLSDAQRADALRVQGSALYALGEREAALHAWRDGMVRARVSGNRTALARLACSQAPALTQSGRNHEARLLLAEADLVSRSFSDPVRRCAVLSALGVQALAEQRLDDAMRQFDDALPLARSAGHRRWEGGLLMNLGVVHYQAGRATESRAQCEAALRIARELGDRQSAANASCNLGLLQTEAGEHTAADASLQSALAAAREIGLAQLEATTSCNLGLLRLQNGQAGDAIKPLVQAATLAARLNAASLAATSERARAEALLAIGEPAAAAEALASARRWADTLSGAARDEVVREIERVEAGVRSQC